LRAGLPASQPVQEGTQLSRLRRLRSGSLAVLLDLLARVGVDQPALDGRVHQVGEQGDLSAAPHGRVCTLHAEEPGDVCRAHRGGRHLAHDLDELQTVGLVVLLRALGQGCPAGGLLVQVPELADRALGGGRVVQLQHGLHGRRAVGAQVDGLAAHRVISVGDKPILARPGLHARQQAEA